VAGSKVLKFFFGDLQVKDEVISDGIILEGERNEFLD